MPELYIGLMSGTSADGIDAGLIDFSNNKVRLIEFFYQAFSPAFSTKIHTISQVDQLIYLKDLGNLDAEFGCMLAEASLALLDKANISASEIKAIGSHGQTVYHAPLPPHGFSLQIGDPNRIAEITGITTVADFRRRDIANGGQGAPLVPAFHQAVFADEREIRTVLNIGGIANITVLNHQSAPAFDTGPGNTLMDFWSKTHLDRAFDENGDWAASGLPDQALLAEFKADEYFQLPPPKSTGREYFSSIWLFDKLKAFPNIPPQNVQATLCQLTADSIAEAISQFAPDSAKILVCGGGAHNRQLLSSLQANLDCELVSTAEFGIHPDHVEACAFAWLAKQTMHQQPGNLCSSTGAKTPVILGGIYPGKSI
jgi:anhydro-N-acetylmuramic acid kinase